MTLAEIAVKLTANTAEFISGFSNAGVATKRFRADLSEHVQAIGGALDGALSHFGEFGSAIGQTLDGAAQAASRAISSFGKLGGAAGTIAGIGAGAVAAILAIDGGAIALAIHTAESAAKLGELSKATGISTESLAGLGLSAKAHGVDIELLAKSLEFMNKTAFQSAIAPIGAQTAWRRLGIDVRDTQGHIKDSTDLFLQAAAKISSLPPGPEQGYFAKVLFGRGGAGLLPLIDDGEAKIKEFVDLAANLKLGDPQTIAAAEKFKETLGVISAEGEGAALRLTKDLLPAMQSIASNIADAFKTGEAQKFIDALAEMVKFSLAVGRALVGVAQEVANLGKIADFNPFGTGTAERGEQAGQKIRAAFDSGGFKAAAAATKSGLGEIFGAYKDFGTNSVQIVTETEKSIQGIFTAKLPEFKPPKPGRSNADTATERDGPLERIRARIEGLNEEAKGWEKVAAAGTESEQFILEAMKKADAEFAKLKAEAAKSPAATAFVLKNEGTIKAAEEEIFFGESVKKAITELDKQKGKLEEQDKAAIELGNAYKLGGNAIREALVKAEFAQQAAVVQDLVAKHEQAVKVFGEESKQAKILADGVSVATQELNALVQAGINKKLHTIANVLSDESRSLAEQAPFVEKLGNAYLQGETAVRRARIELELLNYTLKNNLDPSKDSALIAQKRQLLIDADKQSYDLALKQEAAQFSLNAQYDDQIVKLERVREILQESGQSTLLIDAKIHDSQDSLLHQWDEAAFKVGTFGQKFQGVMGEVVIQGRAAGQAISQAFVSAIDGIETNLAKLLTGQKTNFKQVAQSLAESVTKAEIQKGAGKLAEHIPGLSGILAGKPDGSSEALALWVQLKGVGPASISAGSNNPFAGFGIGSDATGAGSSAGGGLGGLLSLFGGFLADGTDSMSPGNWYIAGERGPEIVKGPGSVIPASKFSSGHNITQNFNYPNAASRDLFGFTERQHAARHQRSLKLAY